MESPSVVVLFTSYQCNARCLMCSSWRKQGANGSLSPEDIGRIFSDTYFNRDIRRINITGGEPTLRDDLEEVVDVLVKNCPHLERVDISTNGLDTVKVINAAEKVLAQLLPTGVMCTFNVSVDGKEEIHDHIRGTPGAFAQLEATLDGLKELMMLYPAFSVGMNATIIKANYDKLSDIYLYSAQKEIGVTFTLAALSEIGVESLPLSGNFVLSEEERKVVAFFIQDLLNSKRINKHYGLFLLHWLERGERKARCLFRSGKTLLCEPDGSLYRCGNFKCFKLGNALYRPVSELLEMHNGFASAYRLKCHTCNSNCAME